MNPLINHNTPRLIFFTIILCFSFLKVTSQTITVSGTLNSNTSWIADTVKITGDVTVDTGVILTIEPGTFIESQSYYKIYVLGSIKAVGTSSDSITFTVNDTTDFSNEYNLAGGWGGIIITNNPAISDTSIFEFCKIQYGKKYDTINENIEGGALKVSNYGTLIIRNSSLLNNRVINHEYVSTNGPTSKGGALYCTNVNSVIIENSRFEKNRTFDIGGAIYLGNNCGALITNNTFINNKAWNSKIVSGYEVSWGNGSGIMTHGYDGPSPVLSGNYFFNNYGVGGVIVSRNTEGLIFNNIISNNYGTTGIEANYYFSTVRIFNNTITNNYSIDGGIFLYSNAKVYNNVVWDNHRFSGEIIDQIQKMFPGTGSAEIFNNCVQYGNGGPNSINQYPEFNSPSGGIGIEYDGSEADWSLKDNSPCVNHGALDTVGLHIPEYDILGNVRIYGIRIDMGCYENQNVLVKVIDTPVNHHHIEVYPNPGTINLNIVSSQPESFFELITMSGQPIIQNNCGTGLNKINTESLNPGIYFYRLLSADNEVLLSGRWIKGVK